MQVNPANGLTIRSARFNAVSQMYCMPVVQNPVALPLRDRLLVVALVVLAHAALMWSWAAQPSLSKPAHHEMSVSLAQPSPPQAAEPEPVAQPATKPRPVEPQRVQPAPQVATAAAPVETPATPPVAANAAPAQPVNAAPGLPDREPDYRAAYLHNPIPAYPMTARRMGWQGRVVLNVEVLAEGSCGDVNVFQSSGHDVLDNAALRTVKGWRFVPASRAGHPITQWFKVPIQFSLKENEA